MKRIGIVVPLPGELRSLTRSKIAAGTITLLTADVVVGLCGMGAERARAMGECLLECNIAGLVSWGSAAALHDTLAPGSLVLPTHIITANGATLETDCDWHTRLRRSLARLVPINYQPITHCNELLCNTEQKRRLCATHHAVAADMESAALASTARQYDIPFIAIRAISDSVALNLPDCVNNAMDEEGQVQPLQVLGNVAWHPTQWPALVQLGRGFRNAQKTLAKVSRCTGPRLLGPANTSAPARVAGATLVRVI